MGFRSLGLGENFINSSSCLFDAKAKQLTVSADVFDWYFPKRILVISSHTKREVWFKCVEPGDRFFDEDQWDGEMQVYVPEVELANVEKLVVLNN